MHTCWRGLGREFDSLFIMYSTLSQDDERRYSQEGYNCTGVLFAVQYHGRQQGGKLKRKIRYTNVKID